jgi:PAS domain S-box-containing protein
MDRNIKDMTDIELQQALKAEKHYRNAESLSDTVAWRATAEGVLSYVAPRWTELTGYSTDEALTLRGATVHPEDFEMVKNAWATCLATGENLSIVARYHIKQSEDDFLWMKIFARAHRDPHGNILRWYGVTENITETKTLIERQQTLLLELNHRVKNSLATVQSIVMQTFRALRERDGYNIDAYRTFCDKVMERLLTLSSAHDLLTRNSWSGTDLNSLLEHTLEAVMSGTRYEISGSVVMLGPNAALLLAMVFHELGTNAIKYGAWSNDGGRIMIGWEVSENSVELIWRERGGPVCKEPDHTGFGTKLITKAGLKELGGTTEMKFDPEGLTCYLRIALSEKVRVLS